MIGWLNERVAEWKVEEHAQKDEWERRTKESLPEK